MKLLSDQGLPRSTVTHLANAGVAAEHVGDVSLERAEDGVILEAARQHGAVVVTFDADFHQLLATSGAGSPSVIRIRIEGLKGDEVATILAQVISTANAELGAGAVVSVTPGRIRVRALPIG